MENAHGLFMIISPLEWGCSLILHIHSLRLHPLEPPLDSLHFYVLEVKAVHFFAQVPLGLESASERTRRICGGETMAMVVPPVIIHLQMGISLIIYSGVPPLLETLYMYYIYIDR